jgi:carbohydrate kinase (thermoresistant glucokinase family)
MKSRFIVLAGVAASGKTTIGRMLASTLTWDFLDADEYHSPENKARMEAGTALTDDDRRPWLELLAGVIMGAIGDRRPAVLACSALSRVHRDALRVGPGVAVLLIHVPEEEIVQRLRGRTGHFFNPALVRCQFEALEMPAADEPTTVIDGNRPPEEVVEDIRRRLDQDDLPSGAP